MSDDLYGFTGEDVDRLRRLLEAYEGGGRLKGIDPAKVRFEPSRPETYLAVTTEAIPAATVSTSVLSTLTAAINSSATAISVASTSTMPAEQPFVIRIDSEELYVGYVTSNTTLTAFRGWNGTTAAAHSNAANVSRTVTTMGSGNALLSQGVLNSSGDYDVEETQAISTTIYNPFASVILDDTRVELVREPISGVLMTTGAGVAGTEVAFAVSSGVITARNGSTLGQGSAYLLTSIDNGAGGRTITVADTTPITVYNECDLILNNWLLDVFRDPFTGLWMCEPRCEYVTTTEGACPCSTETCLTLKYPSIAEAGGTIACNDCTGTPGITGTSLENGVTLTYVGSCRWIGQAWYCSTYRQIELSYSLGTWTLSGEIDPTDYLTIRPPYQFSGTWDCASTMTLNKNTSGPTILGLCSWPATATIELCVDPGTGGGAPTITQATDTFCTTDIILVIAGTGFETTAANNVLTITDGSSTTIANACIAATTTSMTVVLKGIPATGALTATVTNANGTSSTRQVATVFSCTPIWKDLFTDTNGTDLASHTPDTGSGGYTNAGGSLAIQSNKLRHTSGNSDFYTFVPDIIDATESASIDFVFSTAAGRLGLFMDDGSATRPQRFVWYDGASWQIGVPSGASTAVTLSTSTTYTMRVHYHPNGTCAWAVNGVVYTGTFSVLDGIHKWYIRAAAIGASDSDKDFDNLYVNSQ